MIWKASWPYNRPLFFLLNILLLVGILGLSAVATHWYAKAYVTCAACRTLNASRRTQCRKCGRELN